MLPAQRPLTAADLLPVPLRRLGRRVFLHATIDSTNAFLLAHAAEAGDGAVAWAEYQTAGRGRLGRRWEAPRGASVLLSVLLHEPPDAPVLALGALLGTLAACEAVEAVSECTPAVRWPNDLMLGGRKLGGVLAESAALPGTAHRALVIGVGVNCHQHAGHFTDDLARRATSLELESGRSVDRAAVAAALLARLDHWLAAGADEPQGWAAARSAWRAQCGEIGRHARLEHDGRRYAGTVLDITEDGDLILELDRGGRKRFAAATTTRLG